MDAVAHAPCRATPRSLPPQGSPVLDFEALEKAAQYDDGFSRTHPTINMLWEVIHELPLDMQKRFLFFCTGSDRVPIKVCNSTRAHPPKCARQPSIRHSDLIAAPRVLACVGTGPWQSELCDLAQRH